MAPSRLPDLPHALEHLDHLSAEIDGRRPAVFLDYDGTLTPIVDDPDAATLSDAGRRAVRRLASLCPVAIISGRDLTDARSLLDLDQLVVAGSHGFDIAGPGWSHQHEAGQEALPALRQAADELDRRLAGVPGILVERKEFAVTIHVRRVPPEHHDAVADHVAAVAAEHDELRQTGGKMIHELRPDLPWDKGRALSFLLHELSLDTDDVIPIYVGDDETDEDALEVVAGSASGGTPGGASGGTPGLAGIGVVVGHDDRPTAARFRLDHPGETIAWLNGLADTIQARRHTDPWILAYHGFDPQEEGLREALCTLGNGYVALRGALPEVSADEHHYPGTYLSGVYNRLTSRVGDRDIENEDLVNAPNPLAFTWRPGGGAWLDLRTVEVLDHRLELDMRHAQLSRYSRVRDADGRTTTITQRRVVSMENPHLVALETTLVAEDWSGPIEVCSRLDGAVRNRGVARYRGLADEHVRPIRTVAAPADDAPIALEVETVWSRVRIALASRTRVGFGVSASTDPTRVTRSVRDEGHAVVAHLEVELREGEPTVFDIVAAVHTSRDHASGEPLDDASRGVARVDRFGDLLAGHVVSWRHIWNRCRVDAEVDASTSMAVNLHIFHLAQTVSKHTADGDAGIPARGLHGEAYRGHVFWDELFILPFLALRLPGLARGHLMYRYRRLDEARRAAHDAGYRGAMFPWQSGSTGREETQVVHLNPESGRWIPDGSHLQRHINAAVVYNVWQYHEATSDTDFLAFHGAEMIIEIARFWASIAELDLAEGRYRIKGVMGPDEFHERYPDRDEPGLDDNAYTNVMAVWCVERALRVLDEVGPRRADELRDRLTLTDDELDLWSDITHRMRVPFHDGVISQFDGYDQLEEFDWDGYRERHGDISRLDRILEAEGDSPNRYRVSKQADVLMLLYLLSAEELSRIFAALGYRFDAELLHRTVEYYQARTSHGSTLSKVVDAWVLARSDRPRSWNTFVHALRSDLFDVQGGTTPEGIHLGAMAGTVDLLQRCYTGLEPRDGVLWLSPALPAELPRLTLDVRYRRRWLVLSFTDDAVDIEVRPSRLGPVHIGVDGEVHELAPGERQRFVT